MDWVAATAAALQFEPYLTEHVPHLVEEMRGKAWRDENQPNIILTYLGIADGAKVPFASIIALNARTEIALGLVNDGCTSLALRTEAVSLAGQTWDVSEISILEQSSPEMNMPFSPTGISC